MAKPINTPIAGEIWHLSIEDLFSPVHEKQRLGGDGPFVINLSVSTAPINPPAKKFAGCRDAHIYQIQVTEDGRMRYRLRLGPFASEDAADATLDEVRDMYPGALTATALPADLRAIASIQAKLDAVKPAPKMPAKAAVEVAPDLSQPLARAAAIAAATLARSPKPTTRVAPTKTTAPGESANAAPVAVPPADLSPQWAMPALNTRATHANQTGATPSPALALTRAASATPTPIPVAPAPAAIANPAPILTEVVAVTVAPRVSAPTSAASNPPIVAARAPAFAPKMPAAPPPAPVVIEVDAPILQVPHASPAPGKLAPPLTRAPQIAPTSPATVAAPVLVDAVAPMPKDPSVAAVPSNPAPVITRAPEPAARAPEPAPKGPARAARPAFRPVVSRPVIPRWVAPRLPLPRPAASSPAAAHRPAAQTPAAQTPAAKIPAAAQTPAVPSVNHSSAGFVLPQLVAVATVPAAHPVKQLSQPLVDLESTQTVRALTAPELEDDEALRWFVIQLATAEQAFDPDAVPNLDIFSEYRLYSVAWVDQGHNVHALRLGFFSEEIAAVAVASYLGAHYEKPTIRRVSVAERERFAAQRVEARKDVGETGKHAAIEITNELIDRRRRAASAAAKREKSNKSHGQQSPHPR
jgi:hypothetical protein